MTSFACFSTSQEKSTNAYRDLIKRFRAVTKKELGDSFDPDNRCNFEYYTKYKGKSTYCFRDFIYELRKRLLDGVYVLLCENPTPLLKSYIRLIEKQKLQDGRNACAYYGELYKIVTSFMNFFSSTIDDVVNKIDKYINVYTADELLATIDHTEKIYKQNQKIFLREYLPVESKKEQENYEEIVEKQANFLEDLKKMKEHWSSRRRDTLRVLVKENFDQSIKKLNMLCNFTHSYISLMLADRLYQIAVSLEETVDRIHTNLRQYNEECTTNMNRLFHELYEKNKESLKIYRRQKTRSVDTAEVNRAIDVIIAKIENTGNEETISRLELETRYWKKRLKEFNEIASILVKIRHELEKVRNQEQTFKKLRAVELPGSKTYCFTIMGEHLTERRVHLEQKWQEISKTLITFFSVRGTDRILYTDSVGSYYLDEFNHQNYITNFGLKYFHIDCYGQFSENHETAPYYFDENGRYVIENGEKIHQIAPCTSRYKLGEDGLLKKITKDCGHSERHNEHCRLEIKDPTDVVILPKKDIVNIAGTLDSDTVKYLWDNFGMILPEVLCKIAITQPKNPIHIMSHILLQRRFEASPSELKNLKKKAEQYRLKIYNERKEKFAEVNRAWKSKMARRPKPEDLDDSGAQAVYDKYMSDWQFVNSLDYYY